jgi:hypothetical protein
VSEDEGTRRPAPADAMRCPYCKGDLDPDLAVACGGCGTPHHPACFGEHGACTVLGCPSRAASAASNAPQLDVLGQLRAGARYGAGLGLEREGGLVFLARCLRPRVVCDACGKGCGEDALIAHDHPCGRTLHAACFEARGECPCAVCATIGASTALLEPAEARRRNRARVGRFLSTVGAIFGALWLGLLAFAIAGAATGPAVLATLLLLCSLAAFAFGVGLRITTRVPAPAPAGPIQRPAVDLTKDAAKD